MAARTRTVRDLPHALREDARLAERLAGRRPAVFLDYDGVLTPIVDRPEDARISDSMRRAVRALARRCPVCVVSGRDRRVVQDLMGIDDLVVAGSHGFDIWSPVEGTIQHDAAGGFGDIIPEVTERLRAEVGSIEGVRVEPKKAAVAVHYRLVDPVQHERITGVVETLLSEWPDGLKVTPGKMVYELQPKIDWNKGRAVLYLLGALGLDSEDVVPLYLGDDLTDEDAFQVLAGVGGIGILIGDPGDPEVDDRPTAADFVLSSPDEVEQLLSAMAAENDRDQYTAAGQILVYDHFDPGSEGLREALTSTGNGYFCTRGAAEWEDTGVHYPGTYAHGGYNRETTILGGRPVPNEDLVNLPNWLVLKLRINGEEAIRLSNVDLISYQHSYDIRLATVRREVRFRDRAGRVTTLNSRRFVSMAHSHQAGIEWTVTPENWSGHVDVISALDGRVTNQMVSRYRELEGRHLDPVSPRTFGPETIALKVETRQSNIYVAEAARTRVFSDGGQLPVERELYQTEDYIQQVISFEVTQGRPVRVEKIVSLFTTHDNAITETLTAAGRYVLRSPDFAAALEEHIEAWKELWDVCDIELPKEPRTEFLLRFHVAHVLQVCSRHTARHDAGVPARGLNGEAYRGHVFWDELFIYPFLNYRLPGITRALLLYRYRRLTEARAAAREAGYRGAMYPWQSGSDGSEETQVVHLNPLSGQWDPDLSHNQRHVSAAIFYNVWMYYLATDDREFLRDYGAEMMLEIARFWASIAHYNPERDRFEIHGVMGPDEFHERCPGAREGGLRNNAYTNVMVAWIADTAPRVLDLLPASRRAALCTRLGITGEELHRWDEMSRKMYVPFHPDGVISQFEGYYELEELDWERYRAKHGNIQRTDRILRAEGEDPNRFKVAKQADTVMLFFLFSDEELRALFDRLGYRYSADVGRRTIEYYDRRTSHGSTLSLVTHAGVLAARDPKSSWDRFMVALQSDIGDVQGGTTKEGIHMGVMSGTLDLLQRYYAGCDARDGVLYFSPTLLDRLSGLVFSMQFRASSLRISITGDELTVLAHPEGFRGPLRVGVGDEVREIEAGQRCVFSLPHGADAKRSHHGDGL
ncbi:MAG TPA: trehalose-phosphatase [Amycolatopsis sp.]|uniref:trehalose-phosphatase n=1 Tax=Amycolatopsis sp. TaxID=37632 RepID=UPI002B49625D|nr:trehalose-phosphatase [Amycolatopsis sp.]HKS49122.1 trehalose-phosphatase [Amycolatopsis sp.]